MTRGLLLALVVMGLAACSPSDAAPPGPELRFVQLNLCGHRNALPDGCVPDGRSPEQRTAGFADLLADLRPHVATLNEACQEVAEELAAEVTDAGWPLEVTFRSTAGGPWLGCGSKAYGNAVLVHGTVVGQVRGFGISTAASPEAPWEQRGGLCVDARLTGERDRLAACVTHLIPPTFDAAEHERQLQGLLGILAGERRRGVPLVLGGDLNVEPDVVASQFAGLGLRPDGSGPSYRRRKFDFLFTTADLGEHLGVATREVGWSDHRAVVLRLSSRLPSRG